MFAVITVCHGLDLIYIGLDQLVLLILELNLRLEFLFLSDQDVQILVLPLGLIYLCCRSLRSFGRDS